MRRIGILVGDSDPIVEYDLQRFLPRGVSFHIGRMDMPRGAKLAADESLQMMCDAAAPTAEKVAEVQVEFFLFACTAASFFRGPTWDATVCQSITDATGVSATTTATAVAEALSAMGLSQVFMATPYAPEVNTLEVEFLASRGICVTGQHSFGCAFSRDVSHIPPRRIVDGLLAQANEIRAAGGLFVSCTMLRAMEVAEELESELRIPVVTSNTAAIWSVLSAIGVNTSRIPAGQLYRQPQAAAKHRAQL